MKIQVLPACPPASAGSAGERHMAATSAAAGRGGASAAGCPQGRPWWVAGGRGRVRSGERAVRDVQLRLLPLPVIKKRSRTFFQWHHHQDDLWQTSFHLTVKLLNADNDMTPPPHLSPAPPVLQQQMVETRRQLVVGDALTEAAVIVLLQPPVQHHLQLTCTGDSSLNDCVSTALTQRLDVLYCPQTVSKWVSVISDYRQQV